jgi:hypothetical protein
MAVNGCNFCGKVGTQPITNSLKDFDYSCLEVKNKKSNKRINQNQNEKHQSAAKCQVCRRKSNLFLFIFGGEGGG